MSQTNANEKTKVYCPMTDDKWQKLIGALQRHNVVLIEADDAMITFVKREKK